MNKLLTVYHSIEDSDKKKSKFTKQDIKRWTAYTVLTGATLASVYGIGSYLTEPDLHNELKVLEGTSAYLRSYEENDPTKALIYTKLSLEAVKNNPNVKGISDLEKEVAKVEPDIRTSTNKFVFMPVLEYISTRIDDLEKYNEKRDKFSFLYAWFGSLSLGVFGFGFYRHGWLKKK